MSTSILYDQEVARCATEAAGLLTVQAQVYMREAGGRRFMRGDDGLKRRIHIRCGGQTATRQRLPYVH